MNPNNYATLEASKRLIDAGIVLNTDFYWATYAERTLRSLKDAGKAIPAPYLVGRESIHNKHLIGMGSYVSAPSMAEVWLELPDLMLFNGLCYDLALYSFEGQAHAGYQWNSMMRIEFYSTNPTDALIDLLIWVRRKRKG